MKEHPPFHIAFGGFPYYVYASFGQVHVHLFKQPYFRRPHPRTQKQSKEDRELDFIEQTLEEQRQKIENLQKKVDDGIITSGKLKSMIENLQNQLTEKSKDIEGLRAQLAEKDIQIENLGKSVTQLQTENAQVKEESENRAQIVRNQDTQLNTAYFVYGTNKELKEHKILQSGDVLANNDFDRDYFTKIDIRKTTVIPFGSKSAKLLTTHPEGSYTLLKDSKGEYTLRITDPNKFWSVSKYLVVRVK